MKVGIMQPYFFPYIGYFQLMNLTDVYVIYDDVNYITRGWINRNRILNNDSYSYFNLELSSASQNKLIKEIEVIHDAKLTESKLKTLKHTYGRAPYFNDVYPIISEILTYEETNLALYLKNLLTKVASYLGIQTKFILSSEIDKDNTLKGQDKILAICKSLGATEYYNASGGQELYDYDTFAKENIRLAFLEANLTPYKQFNNPFVPGLSIIDVMMFNSKEEIQKMLNDYHLITK